ncbi:MAG: nucleotidyltransferase family protein [Armatimonadota bacterium]
MGSSLDNITEKIISHKSQLKKDFNIKEIGIFGSFVRNEENENSDIDLLVELEKPIDLFRFLDLEEYLSELTGRKVDLVSKKALKPEISKIILQEVVYL